MQEEKAQRGWGEANKRAGGGGEGKGVEQRTGGEKESRGGKVEKARETGGRRRG